MIDPVTAAGGFWDVKFSELLKLAPPVISAAGWPLATVTIVVLLKEKIRDLLTSLSEINLPGGVSAKFFRKELDKLEAKVEKDSPAEARVERPAAIPAAVATPPAVIPPAAPSAEVRTGDATGHTPNRTVEAPQQGAAEERETMVLPPASMFPLSNIQHIVDPVTLKANPTGVVMESWFAIDATLRALANKRGLFEDHLLYKKPLEFIVDVLKKGGVLTTAEVDTILRMFELRNLAARSHNIVSEVDALRFKQLAERIAEKYIEPV